MSTLLVDGSSSSWWGSWEELVLGGAVLRHGADGAWDAVAAELRARSSSSSLFFTPQECQAKYEDILEQYSGCDEWFEELRKRRVAELRRELEKSEDSIGCLQSKLESLTSERDSGSNLEYNTSQAETTSPSEDGVGINSPNELAKGESSAGSYTDKPGRDSSPEGQQLTSVSLQESKLKIQSSEDLMMKSGCGCSWVGFGKLKGKRGKRKRKGYRAGEEDSVGDSDRLSSAVLMDREGSSGNNQETKLSANDSCGSLRGEYDSHLDLASFLDSVMKHKDVSIFKKRLESQKKARYKKMIRRHVDFQNISSRIGNGSISSAKELLRDLLLLSNNALVFYPKNSPEHKSALVLRRLLSNAFMQSLSSQNPIPNSGDGGGSIPDDVVKTERPKSVQPCTSRSIGSAEASGKGDEVPRIGSSEEESRADVAVTSAVRKRGVGRPAKGGPRAVKRLQESPNKGRKRARR
ncbi:uncharacterized protein M6B38_283885 [Iris pallida]|uniref:Bromo domain-containing protein n=1 Tax=Iris pallida TaxID=29817 RepID=A0AAX6I0Q5_IRIPA|nr:uncharacterized protein M6B38_283885 [Iris pallida]